MVIRSTETATSSVKDMDGVYEAERHEPSDALYVGGGPGHQVSGLVPVMKPVTQGLQSERENRGEAGRPHAGR